MPEKSAKRVVARAIAIAVALLCLWFGTVVFRTIVGRSLTAARAGQALASVQAIELAITKMVSDVGQATMADLFNGPALHQTIQQGQTENAITHTQAATAVYTTVTHALLQNGRGVLNPERMPEELHWVPEVLDKSAIQRMATQYLESGRPGRSFAIDPWGVSYQVYIGPWTGPEQAVPFRSRLRPDQDTFRYEHGWIHPENEPELDTAISISAPAPSDQVVYIWSFGANGRNDQPHFSDDPGVTGDDRAAYRSDALPRDLGGGDDVNNWDSSRTWQPFHVGINWRYQFGRFLGTWPPSESESYAVVVDIGDG